MKYKKDFETLCVILAFYGVLFIFGITCPIKYLTGISCPGCGMTRAWICALQLDFSKALSFHPLFWLVPVIILLISQNRNDKLFRGAMVITIILFVGLYVYRMFFMEGNIVVCNPENGLIMKLINIFWRLGYVM